MASIFEDAGFELPKAAAPAAAAPAKAGAPKSIFEAAGFDLSPGKPAAAAPVQNTSWKDAEALENATAAGIQLAPIAPTAPAKPGRGGWQALKDYPGHVLQGIVDTVAAPGNVLASKTPSTSESLIPTALGIAGLVGGSEFPKVGARALIENGLTKAAPSTRATNALVEAIRPENVPEVVAGMRANPRMTAADLSDPVRLTTQGLMAKGTPDVQDFISQAIRERTGTRLDNANSAFTAAMGPAPDVGAMLNGLKTQAREAGQKAIQPAIEKAGPVDVSPVIKAIDEKLQPGIQALLDPGTKLPLSDIQQELLRMKQQLTTPSGETLFDAQRLHRVQSDIGDQAYQLQKSPNPKDRQLGSQLRDMNEKLIDQIDEASKAGAVTEGPGPYRQGRAKFKDAKDIHEAWDEGFDVLKNRSGVNGFEDRPAALEDWMKTATPEQVVAKRLAVRADMDQKINGVKNGALAGQTVTAIPYNQAKLKMLFGDTEATRLIRVMKDAEREAATNAAIFAGSKTAETTAAGDRIAVRKVGGGNPLQYVAPVAAEMLGQSAGLPGAGLIASMAAKGVHMAGQKLGQMHDIATNAAFARNALATGPAREETINALLSHPKVARELKKRANALTVP